MSNDAPEALPTSAQSRKRKTSKVESANTIKKGNVLTISGKPGNVAEYLTAHINLSGKAQVEIAKDVGFPMPNMITMLKKNLTKLPIDKIGKMSKSLGLDPLHLYKMCMAEYYPDTWISIQSFLDQPVITANEFEFIETIRLSNVINPHLSEDDDKRTLIDFVNTLKS